MSNNYNKTKLWREKNRKLCGCGKTIGYNSKNCRSCSLKSKTKDMELKEIKYDNNHKSSNWALVRWRARVICNDLPQVCVNCGYDKHVEVCHIKPISSFPLSTLVSVVNSPENLILLCPNCHWEFDNGILSI